MLIHTALVLARPRPSEIVRSDQLILTCESEESGLGRVLEVAGPATVLYASDYCHWDCHFPYSVKDIVDARDLNDDQREKILSRNAIDFFNLKNLPRPGALKIARQSWEQEERKAAAGK